MPIASPTPKTSRERITPQGNRVRVPRVAYLRANGFEYAERRALAGSSTAVTSPASPA